MDELIVENIKQEDLFEIHKLDRETFPTQHYPYFVLRQLWDIASCFCFCTKHNNQIVGYLICGTDVKKQILWVLAIGVQQGYRKQGIGSILLNKLFNSTVHYNFDSIQATVLPENTNSLQLFEKHNFKVLQNEKDYFGKNENRLLLKRS